MGVFSTVSRFSVLGLAFIDLGLVWARTSWRGCSVYCFGV